MPMIRPASLWPFAALALALLLHGPADATCGGGGGGGSGRGGAGQAYRTTWTGKAFEAALAEAAGKSQGAVLYFPPAEQEGGRAKSGKGDGKTEHRFFTTKIPNDASKERVFYKAQGDAAKKLREQYEPKSEMHVILVCDWYGNTFKTFRATDSVKVDGKQLRTTLYAMDKLVNRLVKKLDAQANAAAKSVDALGWATAIEALSSLLDYRGHEPIERAKALWARVEEAGNGAVDEALRIEDPAARTKRLQEIKKTFAGTKVEHRCKVELGEAPREAPREEPAATKPASSDALPGAAAAWGEEFLGVDFEALPLSQAEQTEVALREGIALEAAGRYEEARQRYELACALDPRDSIALVYLGELYRHHVGDWDAAEKTMRRVVELDNDDFAMAVALHGLGKMTIWRGDDKAGLALMERSIERHQTPLCYRNLAIYWTGDKTSRKAFEYATKAYELDPDDGYNQVFYSIYLLLDGRADEARHLFGKAEFDPSMSYNCACYHAVKGEREKVLHYLKRHFYEYEQFEAVRSFEMAEARMDALFAPWYEDRDFKELTAKARATPWLGAGG